MSNLIEFAKTELAILRGPNPKPDEMQDAIEANVLKIVAAFAEEGHSGSSAAYTLSIIKKVLAYEPVTPLTGSDEEWTVLGYDSDIAAQNKRCPHVFKRADGTAFDTQAVVFEDPDGARCTNYDSRRDITFPYWPKITVVKRGVPAAPTLERVRHLKRGFEYEVLGEAEAQVAVGAYMTWPEGVEPESDGVPAILLHDGLKLTVYRAADGKLWVRPTDEFRDGRFETISPATPKEA